MRLPNRPFLVVTAAARRSVVSLDMDMDRLKPDVLVELVSVLPESGLSGAESTLVTTRLVSPGYLSSTPESTVWLEDSE